MGHISIDDIAPAGLWPCLVRLLLDLHVKKVGPIIKISLNTKTQFWPVIHKTR